MAIPPFVKPETGPQKQQAPDVFTAILAELRALRQELAAQNHRAERRRIVEIYCSTLGVLPAEDYREINNITDEEIAMYGRLDKLDVMHLDEIISAKTKINVSVDAEKLAQAGYTVHPRA